MLQAIKMELPDTSKVGVAPPQMLGGLASVKGGMVNPGMSQAIAPVNPAAASNMASRAKAKELGIRDEYDQAKEIRANEEAERVRLQGFDESQAVRQWQRQNEVYDDEVDWERSREKRALNHKITKYSHETAQENHEHIKKKRMLDLKVDLSKLKNDIANSNNLDSHRASVDRQLKLMDDQLTSLEGKLLMGVLSSANTKYAADDDAAVDALDLYAERHKYDTYKDILDANDLAVQKLIANEILFSDDMTFGVQAMKASSEAEAESLRENYTRLNEVRAKLGKGIDPAAAQELVRAYEEMIGIQPGESTFDPSPSAPKTDAPAGTGGFLNTLTPGQEAQIKNFLVKEGQLKPGQSVDEVSEDVVKAAWDKISTSGKLGNAKAAMDATATELEDFGDLDITLLNIPGWIYEGGEWFYNAVGAGVGEHNLNVAVGTTLSTVALQQLISKNSTFKKAILKANGSSGRLAAARQGGGIRKGNLNPDPKLKQPNPVTTPQQPKHPGPNATDQQKKDYRKSLQQQPGPQQSDPQARAEKAKKLKADWIKADQKLASSYKDFAQKHGYKAGPKPPANGGTPDERRNWRKATLDHFKNEVANHKKTIFQRFTKRVKNYKPGGKAALAGWIATGTVLFNATDSLIKSFGLGAAEEELKDLIKEAKEREATYKALLKVEKLHSQAYIDIVKGTPAPTDSGAGIIAPANPPPSAPPPIPPGVIQTPTGGTQTPGGASIATPPPTAIQTPTGGTQTPGGASIATPPPPPELELVKQKFSEHIGEDLTGDLRVDDRYDPQTGTYQFGYLTEEFFMQGTITPAGEIKTLHSDRRPDLPPKETDANATNPIVTPVAP